MTELEKTLMTLARQKYPPCCGEARAQTIGCVCEIVYLCAIHGESHRGTHD